ncbi:MAG: VCBS repeat-containing protein [bacterium]|nr:VCBS repeat-containing protein [bacterium]
MSTRSAPAACILMLACLLVAAPAAGQERYPAETNLLEVLFIPESAVRLVGGVLVDHSGLDATAGIDALLMPRLHDWERLSDVPEPVLDTWELEGEARTGQDLSNLNNIYRLRFALPEPALWLLAADLEALPGVHLAYPVPLPQELPVPGSFVSLQRYLNPPAPAPAGINALYAWSQTGGNGAGVTVCDIEYDWNYNHLDVTKALGSQLIAGCTDPFAGTATPSAPHGTGVVGVLASDSNGWGTTGINHGSSLLTCGSHYGPTPSWNLPGALQVAINALQAGDVILLELQWDSTFNPSLKKFVPVEWWGATNGMAQQQNAVYLAIQTAVALGIHVVEAGGNGNVDTGAMTWAGDSGAIIVGAGGTGLTARGDRVRMGWSSYGPRFDLQGWGENVVTTGHNADLHSSEGLNLHYTQTFNGTSSASPVVAGAVACLQGWWAGLGQTTPITPAVMRAALRMTGTPQDSVGLKPIGPRPDLLAAITQLTPAASWTDVTSGPLGDTGLTNSIAWGDREGDGDPDLYVVNFQSSAKLLENFGGGVFMDFTAMPEANQAAGGAAEWGDYDNDGDPDLYVGNVQAGNRLLRNNLMSFSDLMMMPESDPSDAAGVTWLDVDNDGTLDLYVTNINGATNRLFTGQVMPGGLQTWYFDMTQPPLDDPDDSRDAAWADYDGDGDLDCYLTKYGIQPGRMLRNDWPMFADATLGALHDSGPSFGACWGDYDNDGDLDLYIVKAAGLPNRLLRNDGGGNFMDVTAGPLADTGGGYGACWGDYDNDGDLDLYVVNGCNSGFSCVANRLLRNDGGGTFSDDTNGPLGDMGLGRAAAFADYDLDGDLDLYVANWGSANKLLRNDINNGNAWLQVKLRGVGRNRSGIGARVTVWSPTLGMQMREVSDMTAGPGQGDLLVEFGLGAETRVDSLHVAWPAGYVQRFGLLPVNTVHPVVEHPAAPVDDTLPPAKLALAGAQPNPFNPATTILCDIPRAGRAELVVYDARGRLVRRLLDGPVAQGRLPVAWDGRGDDGREMAAGVYVARLRADGEVASLKLVLVK